MPQKAKHISIRINDKTYTVKLRLDEAVTKLTCVSGVQSDPGPCCVAQNSAICT